MSASEIDSLRDALHDARMERAYLRRVLREIEEKTWRLIDQIGAAERVQKAVPKELPHRLNHAVDAA